MTTLPVLLPIACLFLAAAVVHASAGLGGGSSYIAILVLFNVDIAAIPLVALLCNIVVSAQGSIRFARNGLVPWRMLATLVLFSAPAAFVGGALSLPPDATRTVLACGLLCAGTLLVIKVPQGPPKAGAGGRFRLPLFAAAGTGLGLLAGITGIGGGIFLAPALHLLAVDTARRIAATASCFILVNSLSGVAGQLSKAEGAGDPLAFALPLALVALVGGLAGSTLAIRGLGPTGIRRITGVIVIAVAIRLFWKVAFGQP